jgi:sarcosine oxidase subunit gamma
MSKSTSPSLNAFLRSPLHAFDLARRDASSPSARGVVASELSHLGYVVVRGRGDDAAFCAGVSRVLGVSLPLRPCSLARFTGGVTLWLSPDEWLLVCRRSGRDALVHSLNEALAGLHAQVVDNSGGLTTLRLSGPEHLRLLRHLGPYDFESLRPSICVGTTFSKAQVTVVRTDADGVLLVSRRSFADYLWRLIERTALPYGLVCTAPLNNADPLFTPLLENA